MKMISRTQTGRSMVEILGVLAVIGILSVGGIVGYIYAMNLWRENQTIDSVNQTAMGAVSGYLGTEYDEAAADTPLNLANVTSGISLADDATVETAQGTNLTAYRPGESEIELEVENVTYSACKRLLSRPGEYSTASTPDRGTWVLSDDSEEDKDAFCRSIDDQERTPMRPGDRVNPNANMILCYSLSGRGCHGIPPEVPPVACTDYNLCGQQCGMDVHVHPDKQRNPANPCQICNVSDDFNSWQTVANCCNSNAECTGECEVCNTGTHHCELQGIESSYKKREGYCCVEETYKHCAGEAARMDECSRDMTAVRVAIVPGECTATEEVVNFCTGAVESVSTVMRPDTTSCGEDGCSQCDGNGHCVSHLASVTHSDLNTETCSCENTVQNYCPLNGGRSPRPRRCSVPEEPACPSAIARCLVCPCCALTGPNDACGRPTPQFADKVVIQKCDGSLENCCPLTAPGGVCQDETNCSCKVGSNTYAHGETIGECKQCNNGSIEAKSGYTVPSCKVCNNDGTVTNDTTCCTVGTTTYENGATIGTCKQCNNGSIEAKSGYTLPNCKVCNTDGTLGNDTTCCSFGGKMYANGDTVEDCGVCQNGTIHERTNGCYTCNTSTWKAAGLKYTHGVYDLTAAKYYNPPSGGTYYACCDGEQCCTPNPDKWRCQYGSNLNNLNHYKEHIPASQITAR